MSKSNLVLVHSFPTNSILLKGLIEYLSDHFTVYFVDLPGFTNEVPPLKRVSIDSYASFLSSKISNLNLSEYFLGGISFGFLVVNYLPPTPECKGILAMEPFLGNSSIRMNWFNRYIVLVVIFVILFFRAESLIWRSRWLRKRISSDGTSEALDLVIKEVDPKTFFSTALLLLNWNKSVVFHDIRYVLSINLNDSTIDAEHVMNIFKKGTVNLLISSNSVEHYPKTITKEYFASHIPLHEVGRIKQFLEV